jgi:hypothetical protein
VNYTSQPVDEWDWVAGGVEFGPMTPLWYCIINTGISYETVVNAHGKQLSKMIRQKWYVMELNCDRNIFNMICRDGCHVVIIAII